MPDGIVTVITVVSVAGCGLLAGLFFAFSVSIMPGLGQLPADQAITAMQRMNAAILNPVFGLVFGGTTITCLFLAVSALFTLDHAGAVLRLAGSLVVLIGAIAVTFTVNVPMNNALEATDPAGGADLWARYLARWTAWNHIRALTSVAAVTLLAVSLLRR